MSNGDRPKLGFSDLVGRIEELHRNLQASATKSVNIMLTLRNWLIGFYIAEYELQGLDRADYGGKIIECLANELKKLDVSRTDKRELYRYLKFYKAYPQIVETVSPQLQLLAGESIINSICLPQSKPIIQETKKVETLSPQLQPDIVQMIRNLSFSHIVELLEIDAPEQRDFYCQQCIAANWSVRQLRRQIKSLYYERSLLSKDKDKLSSETAQTAELQTPMHIIKDPYVFEFLGLKAKDVLSESDLENQLLDNLQEFLMELGHGFCFEARQKRILIGDTQFYIDLVFYHRVLKCHILIELKLAEFSHENIGQLNTYVSWYRENEMREGDNPPVGILLCTSKDSTLVKYALAGMDSNLFVSKYLLELPSKEEMQAFLERSLKQGLSSI
ncbi:MAG TPA: cytoplasmic protein [Candidatus Cloacimonas sp.]|jgi:predicted nuclease of restriction endonuclease-like (RecB) superfamily|nr:cytoplasmic protein [Candidatus Cloacimonas sp.]